MRTSLALATLAAAVAAPRAAAQFFLVTDSTNERVLLLDANDGALIDPVYLDLTPAAPTLPIEALAVGNQIWVTDQIGNKLMRFASDGTAFYGNVYSGFDEIHGLALNDGKVFVANAGSPVTSPGDTLLMLSTNASLLGWFATPDPADVLAFGRDVLVSDSTGDDVTRYATTGALVGTFHASDGVTGIHAPAQLALTATGTVIAAGGAGASGIYEYDGGGNPLNYYAAPGAIRGIAQLANGRYLFTNANGVHTFDPVSGSLADIATGFEAHYISPFAGAPPATVAFCSGDGSLTDHTTPCPCGNVGAPGNGCAHSFDADGANLSASGNPPNDDVVLHALFEPANSFTLFLQHDAQGDTAFHDGVLCASGNLVRLRGHVAAGGEAFFPDASSAQDSTTTLSQRGGVSPGHGVRRYYSAWYRNASTSFCPPATANVTNGIRVDW